MLGYLNITGLQKSALLLNFKNAKLDWKRIVNEENLRATTKSSSEGISPEACSEFLHPRYPRHPR